MRYCENDGWRYCEDGKKGERVSKMTAAVSSSV